MSVRLVVLPALGLCLLGGVRGGWAAFNPPRIVQVLRGVAPSGALDGQSDNSRYVINKGVEANVNEGDELNVYREQKVRGVERPLRLFIGTMVVTDSQTGTSVGRFIANAEALAQPMIRFKSALRNDIVMPRLIIDSGVLFDAGKADLRSGAGEEFKKVADFVQNFTPSKIIIEGHTDGDGDDMSNQKLSEQRAERVRQYLTTAFSFITPGMVEAKGFGESRPIAANDIPENKALNRRIEVIVWE
jgi:outer membrane protein OmpA-like peptidoglycan-associated protein